MGSRREVCTHRESVSGVCSTCWVKSYQTHAQLLPVGRSGRRFQGLEGKCSPPLNRQPLPAPAPMTARSTAVPQGPAAHGAQAAGVRLGACQPGRQRSRRVRRLVHTPCARHSLPAGVVPAQPGAGLHGHGSHPPTSPQAHTHKSTGSPPPPTHKSTGRMRCAPRACGLPLGSVQEARTDALQAWWPPPPHPVSPHVMRSCRPEQRFQTCSTPLAPGPPPSRPWSRAL